MFKPGNKLGQGRPKGVKNNPDVASLRVLLEDAFLRNRSAAIAKIDKMFQGEDMADFKFMLSLKASIEPKQPFIINNNTEHHTHHTNITLNGKEADELIYMATGRVGVK